MPLTTCLFIIEINFVTKSSYTRLFINNVLARLLPQKFFIVTHVNTKVTNTNWQLYSLHLQNWIKSEKEKLDFHLEIDSYLYQFYLADLMQIRDCPYSHLGTNFQKKQKLTKIE